MGFARKRDEKIVGYILLNIFAPYNRIITDNIITKMNQNQTIDRDFSFPKPFSITFETPESFPLFDIV